MILTIGLSVLIANSMPPPRSVHLERPRRMLPAVASRTTSFAGA